MSVEKEVRKLIDYYNNEAPRLNKQNLRRGVGGGLKRVEKEKFAIEVFTQAVDIVCASNPNKYNNLKMVRENLKLSSGLSDGLDYSIYNNNTLLIRAEVKSYNDVGMTKRFFAEVRKFQRENHNVNALLLVLERALSHKAWEGEQKDANNDGLRYDYFRLFPTMRQFHKGIPGTLTRDEVSSLVANLDSALTLALTRTSK